MVEIDGEELRRVLTEQERLTITLRDERDAALARIAALRAALEQIGTGVVEWKDARVWIERMAVNALAVDDAAGQTRP